MRLPQISGLKLIKVLSRFGFVIVRQGGHIRLEKKINGEMIKLTVPMHNQLKRGTLSRIIKDSKIDEGEFVSFL